MPRPSDQTQMWWADGFPQLIPSAPWIRVVQTGNFAFALNTESLQVRHFGSVRGLDSDWRALPSASLSLDLIVDGETYHCTAGGKWSHSKGPRLIESGCWLQRADITDLVFEASDGRKLSADARFESAAWPDTLAFTLAARPRPNPIPPGEAAFGRIGGGFGLDGDNHFEIEHTPEIDPEEFTLELWAFVPSDYQPTEKHMTYLVSKNGNEQVNGNFSIIVVRGGLRAQLNIGGGAQNVITVTNAKGALKLDAWNHIAISYDNDAFRLFLNGELSNECTVARKRTSGTGGLAFGRRQDNSDGGSHFRGVVDEIRIYNRALSLRELRSRLRSPEKHDPELNPVAEWSFDPAGLSSVFKPRTAWREASMEIRFTTQNGTLHQRIEIPRASLDFQDRWQAVTLAFQPVDFTETLQSPLRVEAATMPSGKPCSVKYLPNLACFEVSLDQPEILPPPGGTNPSNDALERFSFVIVNPTDHEQTARILFDKTLEGIRGQRIGTPITGISAVLRDSAGNPTGLPVQLSKNWHADESLDEFSKVWFHGCSQIRVPAKTTVELELTICYGHWGGVPAASHSQLCLIGWGHNQQWDQSALGSWGETICYEPDQAQAKCTVTDVRPLLVRSMDANATASNAQWGWTNNLGGADFLCFFDAAGARVNHSAMRTTYHRQGPCLTEVTYSGKVGQAITHAVTASLRRTDDVPRAVYRVRMDVHQPVEFSRLSFFQASADTYASSREHKMALGNETGLLNEWKTHWGQNSSCAPPMEWPGRVPWASIHDAVPNESNHGALANRAVILRDWHAQIAGKSASPWIEEKGATLAGNSFSNLNLVPPPDVHKLEPGDFLEATIEYVVLPQFAADYYGPNQELQTALQAHQNTWRMAAREALGNDVHVEVERGELVRLHPAVTVRAADGNAVLTLRGGLGYVPVSFTALAAASGFTVFIDGQPLNQSVHGSDFWQADFDRENKRWTLTFNISLRDGKTHLIRLSPNQ